MIMGKSLGLVDKGSTPNMERLLDGKPVFYTVKNQATKVLGRDPILVITPLSLYDSSSYNDSDLLVSLEGAGCWHISTQKKIRPLDLYMTGLSMVASRQLADRLNKVYKGEKNE